MSRHKQMHRYMGMVHRQRGVVLFIALIALVVIMLAAVALVRSVDTSSLIAGNISFRKAATSSADSGLESAIAWLSAQQLADQAKNIDTDATHVLNVTNKSSGYYSNLDPLDPDLNFTSATTWSDQFSANAGADASGNNVRYIIQRMCSTKDVVPTPGNCIFSDAETKTDSMDTTKPHPEKSASSVMYRVTVRVTGPRNTISYVQGFIY